MFNNAAQSQQQPQQQGQAVKIDWTNLAPYHKFNELHDNVKQEVEAAEKYILAEIQKSEGLAAAFPEHREMIQSVSGDAELMERVCYPCMKYGYPGTHELIRYGLT